jgi:hypothetical protein
MSGVLISLVFGIGVAGWTYAQVERRSGVSNAKTSATAAAIAGFIAFIFLLTITKFVVHL